VTRENVDPELFEIISVARIRVASRDPHASPRQQFGQRAHSRTRDSDKVDGACVGGVKQSQAEFFRRHLIPRFNEILDAN
jgi:hypothetical protein